MLGPMSMRRGKVLVQSWWLLSIAADLGGCSAGSEQGEVKMDRGSDQSSKGGMGGAEPAPSSPAMGGSAESGSGYSISACPSGTQGFAEEVIQADFGEGESFGQSKMPDIVLGGPRGGGCCSGALDVVSLGNGGSIVLGFGERAIIDGPGDDLIVFEIAFWAGGDESAAFVEWGQVAISDDGKTWHEFPCDPNTGAGCAGRTPTFAHPDQQGVSVFDPEQAGGDAFDLSDLGVKMARYVRISDLPDDDMGFDLDAVAIVHGTCR